MIRQPGVTGGRTFCAVLFVILLAFSDVVLAADASQWRVSELTFQSDRDYRDPFDFEVAGLSAEFVGPANQRFVVPGFWDGERTWRIRFTPTVPGEWVYVTRSHDAGDHGLNEQHGSLTAGPPSGETALRRHGGFLRSSVNGRYLTYTDGTPFFWLGDTWWTVPSEAPSLAQFSQMVERRVTQGFSVFQAHGYTGFEPTPGLTVFEAVKKGGGNAVQLWRRSDEYFAYAEQRGILAVSGFATGHVLDDVSLRDLERLWFYYLARYGAYPVTFLITQEYNADVGDKKGRVRKIRELGRFIHEHDPYKRVFSVHPWVNSKDGREAWAEDWYGFAMLQSGHFVNATCDAYLRARDVSPARPVVESETNYEAFARSGFQVDAAVIRRSAYTAFQCGVAGFTYGAQGLYAGIVSKEQPASTAKWGPVLTWDQGLGLPGASQLEHLVRLYETLDWWRLQPWPADRATGGALVQTLGDELVVAYLPSAPGQRADVKVLGLPNRAHYVADWFDPRTGAMSRVTGTLSLDGATLRVPPAPSSEDWVFVARLVKD